MCDRRYYCGQFKKISCYALTTAFSEVQWYARLSICNLTLSLHYHRLLQKKILKLQLSESLFPLRVASFLPLEVLEGGLKRKEIEASSSSGCWPQLRSSTAASPPPPGLCKFSCKTSTGIVSGDL